MSETTLATVTPETGEVAELKTETSAAAVAATSKALVEARYAVAIGRPRDMDKVRLDVLKACARPRFAAAARYQITNRGEGFTIRFAEEVARAYGNLLIDSVVVFDDRERRIVRVTVTDLERNIVYDYDAAVAKTIERKRPKRGQEVLGSRENSQGETVYILAASDDEVLTKQNAAISKAIRTGILRLLPGDIADEALDEVNETMRKNDKADPEAARKKVFDAFGSLGIMPAELVQYVGKPPEQFLAADLKGLREIYTAIRDGDAKWSDYLDDDAPKRGTAGLAAALDGNETAADKAARAEELDFRERERGPDDDPR